MFRIQKALLRQGLFLLSRHRITSVIDFGWSPIVNDVLLSLAVPGSPDLIDWGSVGPCVFTTISTVSTMCSANSRKCQLTCDDERVLGGGCSGLVMNGGNHRLTSCGVSDWAHIFVQCLTNRQDVHRLDSRQLVQQSIQVRRLDRTCPTQKIELVYFQELM